MCHTTSSWVIHALFCHTCFRTGFDKLFHWIGRLVWCFWHIAQFNLRWSLRDATTLDGMTLTIRVTLSFLAPLLVIILCGWRQCVWRWIQQWSILRHPCKQHQKIQIDLQWMWGYTHRERACQTCQYILHLSWMIHNFPIFSSSKKWGFENANSLAIYGRRSTRTANAHWLLLDYFLPLSVLSLPTLQMKSQTDGHCDS